MYLWFPYKILKLFECQYNIPLPKVHTHMISYSFPNDEMRGSFYAIPSIDLFDFVEMEYALQRYLLIEQIATRLNAVYPFVKEPAKIFF